MNPEKTVLEAVHLSHAYRIPGSTVAVLADVDLSVAAGEKVAILGRSGSGKSTLLHILGGLLKPTSGTVRRPANLGFVFQAYHLMPELTVLENVVLPTRTGLRGIPTGARARARARDLLRTSSLTQEEIAAACGFCDASHMGHHFRRRFGAPPSAFRR